MAAVLGVALGVACSSGPAPTTSVVSEYLSLILASTNTGYPTSTPGAIGISQKPLTPDFVTCSFEGTSGLCLAPTAMKGHIGLISLKSAATAGVPARLMGGSTDINEDGGTTTFAFDMSNPTQIPGESNLEEAPVGKIWDTADLNFAYLDIQLPVHGEYWNVRLAFTTQPLNEVPAIVACMDPAALANVAANSTLIPGATFKRGDVMLCKKPNEFDSCPPADYRWLDPDGGQFVATRPASPLQLAYIANNAITCAVDGTGKPQVTIPGGSVLASLANPFGMWAKLDKCNKTFSYKSSADAGVVEGNSLKVIFHFDLSNAVFFKNVTDAGATDAQLLSALTISSIFLEEKNNGALSFTAPVSAQTEVLLTNEAPSVCTSPVDGGGGADGGGGSFDAGSMSGDGGPLDPPPGCTPDTPIRATDSTGQACMHQPCTTPDWLPIDAGTSWAYKTYKNADGGTCYSYCIKQYCPDHFGAWGTSYCFPACN